MGFVSGRKPEQALAGPSLCFVVDRGRILVRREQGALPFPEARELGLPEGEGLYLGARSGSPCLLVHGEGEAPAPEGFEWVELRALFGRVEDELFWIAGRANHLAAWDRAHRWCGACAGALALKPEEWAKACPACGRTYFPQISPAVIVSVLDGDRILLTRNSHYRYPNFTVLAGFVEPGETLEEAVRREIREEVGLEVTNLRYVGSQPWPFPDSLMIGFTADLAGGELRPDPSEILEARWFTREELPDMPASPSIARRMIDAFAG